MYQLIIYGPPGVGKGTQAELIAKKLNLSHISTGAILRNAFEEKTELGLKAKEIMDKGNLVPDDIMNGIVKESLLKISKQGFILDGYPRTIEQAKALSEVFRELNFNNVTVINLSADDREIIKRLLLRGRSDDTKETIENRIRVYNESTFPVKKYFEEKKITKEIYGIGEIEEINQNIIDILQ